MTFPDYEAAVIAYGFYGLNGDGTPVTPDDIANMATIVDAALTGKTLYEECPVCHGTGIVNHSGPIQPFPDQCLCSVGFVQVWPVEVNGD